MKQIFLLLLIFLCGVPCNAAGKVAEPNRAKRYSVYKAHTIMPESFRYVIKKNGKHLFAGLERGLRVPHTQVTADLIMKENKKITAMVDKQAAFKAVADQMGYVAGLIAVATDPSKKGSPAVRKGFGFYLNYKLPKFLFVFDGYPGPDVEEVWLKAQVSEALDKTGQYRNILEKGYRQVNGNARYRFSERHPVFGVCSIYFSNVARLSAHLWYYAWAAAHGDLNRTPLLRKNLHKYKKKSS